MKFTDIFVKRPVLASAINLLILLIGLRSITMLDVRQYPKIENTVITVTTAYPGASSKLIKGFITTPLQQAIAEAQGIDYILSTSTLGLSTIEAHMELNYDTSAAIAEIQAKVASQRNVLPEAAQSPVIFSTTGSSSALLYMAFYSQKMSPAQITDYLLRVVRPKIQAVPGVGKAELIGNKSFAMRIWLNPDRMAALGVTATDVREVLLANNYLAAIGQTKGAYVSLTLTATTDISDEEAFLDLVVREDEGVLVRLKDIAEPELGAENYNTVSWYNGKVAIFIGIKQSPGANPLDIAARLHELMPKIRSQLPKGLKGYIVYDASTYIENAIDEVFKTLWEAVLIVLAVIFLFLGSFRAALIPAVTVPLSLIGSAIFMLALGFSLNLLTLLAMVLAIGLVVDDAIIVVENIHRHIESGASRFGAAIEGARELALPIIAMTTTLVAVYAPIGFMGGLVGSLFTEFAFTLACAVLVSGLVALTLSPMLASKVLATTGKAGRFEQWVEHVFTGLARRYQKLLHYSLNYLPVTMVFAVIMLVSIYFMYVTTQSELAPTEDQSILFFQATAPQTATIDYDKAYARQIIDVFKTIPDTEREESFILLGMGSPSTVFGGLALTPPSERDRSQKAIRLELQKKLRKIAGFDIAVFPKPSLPGSGGGLPVQFVVTAAADYVRLNRAADELIKQAMATGKFVFLKKSVKFTRPRVTLKVNRDLAGDLGIRMKEIARNLGTMLGGGYVNRFNLSGRSYKVIPQVARRFRLRPEMLKHYYIRANSGDLIPLSALVTLKKTVVPSKRVQFQQLNAVTVQGIMAKGVTLGEALNTLETLAQEIFPTGLGFGWDYKGQSRQYVKQGTALVVTFFLSILVIYLVLAAQFESWRDSLIILVSVPMSIAGALIFLTLGFATINIYTQVGLITLIGLIAKNGILIVEFANQLQVDEGLGKRDAIEKASGIRLRPILMTTIAMIVAMIPLLTASGPGAVSRFHIGLVIAAGLGIGTLFTLFVVPAVYLLLARRHEASKEIEEAAGEEVSAET